MSALEGIWTTEYYGTFGWDRTGFLMFSNGEVIGGGRNHYTRGTYKRDGDTVVLDVSLDYFGEPRTLFGTRTRQFDVHFEGELSGTEILGNAVRPGKNVFPLHCRLTLYAPLPSAQGG